MRAPWHRRLRERRLLRTVALSLLASILGGCARHMPTRAESPQSESAAGGAATLEAISYGLRYDAPAACPDHDQFIAQVTSLRQKVTTAPNARLEVRIVLVPDGAHGVLSKSDDTGEPVERTLDGQSCNDVAHALALVAALALDSVEVTPGNKTGDLIKHPKPSAPSPRLLFGQKRQWVMTASSTSASLTSEAFANSQAGRLYANLAVGADTFFADRVSIGFDTELTFADEKAYFLAGVQPIFVDETVSWGLAGGVRLGADVPFGRYFSWYPRLTLGVAWSSSTTPELGVSVWTAGPWVRLFMPVLYHPVSHFFFGLGPRIDHTFVAVHNGNYDGAISTLVNVDLVVGGWWGGAPDHNSTEEQQDLSTFGDPHEVVLTSAAGGSIGALATTTAGASKAHADFSPGLDYFFLRHLSIGASLLLSYSSGTTLGPNTAPTPSSSPGLSLGVASRVGWAFSAVPHTLSLWPLVGISVALSGPADGRTSVFASLPILLHLTPRFFAGVTPTLSHDILNATLQSAETTVAADVWLGTWL